MTGDVWARDHFGYGRVAMRVWVDAALKTV